MHTPGPWRSARFETGEYYTYQICAAAGHIASVVGWTNFGSTCPTTEANARLIAHAPDLVTALQSLVAWADTMGGWEAACGRQRGARSPVRSAARIPNTREGRPQADAPSDDRPIIKNWIPQLRARFSAARAEVETKDQIVRDFLRPETHSITLLRRN